MEAFVDESGTHKGSSILTVGAVLGSHQQWRRFLSYWGERPFHAKDPKCGPLKPALFDAICDSNLEIFVASVRPQDYRNHTTAQFRGGLGNAYAVCAFAAAIGACRFCKNNKLGRISFVIEGGQANVDYIRSALEYARMRERLGIASVAVANKKDFVQLCTADFVAHSCSRENEWFARLWDTGRLSKSFISAERLVQMSEQIGEGQKRLKLERKHV